MAFDTVDRRRSGLNLATFGVSALLFVPLTTDGTFSTDDAENVLGWYIGVDVEITLPENPPGYSVTPGAIGEFRKQVVWNRLGMAYDRVYEFSFTDPVKWIINSAFLDVELVGGGLISGSTGALGEFIKRQSWGRLGSSRDRVYEFTFSDPVKWVIVNAFIEVE